MENEGRVIGLAFPEAKEEPKPKATEPKKETTKKK